MQTLTFPAPAFAHLIEHGMAKTIDVMVPQPDSVTYLKPSASSRRRR